MKFKSRENRGLNYNKEYLNLFKELIIQLLIMGEAVADIVTFSENLTHNNYFNYDYALLAGIRNYTTVEDRYKILNEIENEK